ncbi:MAG: ferredoxin [Bacilli bacterium]|nr:ferredoxin [Bacilli bacterium]
MKVKIIEDACIGCGACEAAVPEVFQLNDAGIATVKNEKITKENEDEVMDAVEACPVGAIEIDEEED